MQWPGLDRWLSGPFERELMPMSWSQLRSLSAAGWEIGLHSASHRHLTELVDGALEAELVRSKAACEPQISDECTVLAYPCGNIGRALVAASRRRTGRWSGRASAFTMWTERIAFA